jgi:hypothetical protein
LKVLDKTMQVSIFFSDALKFIMVSDILQWNMCIKFIFIEKNKIEPWNWVIFQTYLIGFSLSLNSIKFIVMNYYNLKEGSDKPQISK